VTALLHEVHTHFGNSLEPGFSMQGLQALTGRLWNNTHDEMMMKDRRQSQSGAKPTTRVLNKYIIFVSSHFSSNRVNCLTL
jgi:hypothetical protein